jgi:nitroimidazol reductase NimA-like FMN-containing flavoprotein (pyridoxamine 5'-phosphate oxidase superfamily)
MTKEAAVADREARLETLSHEECVALLRDGVVGRIAFSVDDVPVILPVNYRLMETAGRVWIALRTRPGNVIERAPVNVAFQIDSIDHVNHQGWSVLARGTLHEVDPGAADFRARFDPEPWIEVARDSWLIIDPFAITGRRLVGKQPEWAFVDGAYL